MYTVCCRREDLFIIPKTFSFSKEPARAPPWLVTSTFTKEYKKYVESVQILFEKKPKFEKKIMNTP